jgi:Family of unknown function (DUF5677)
MPEQRLVIGFPDFWPEVENKYPRFFEVGRNLTTALHSVIDREYPKPEPHQRAILNLSMLAGVTMTEIVTLAANGMGQGAMKCLRTLLETSINVEYLRLHPAEFEDYKEWFHVERFREVEFLRSNLPDVFKQLDPDAVKDVQLNMDRVRSRFEFTRKDGTKDQRSTWCSRNLADRAVQTGYSEVYRLVNATASGFIHSSMYALVRYFDADKDVHRIDVPPSLEWTAQALCAAHHCMVRVVETVSKTFNVDPDPPLKHLQEELHRAWP